MKFSNWIIGSMTASLILATPLVTQAEDTAMEPVKFLVSLQDDIGNHVCNGTYLGNGQILTGAQCKQSLSVGLPPIGLPIDPPVIITPAPGSVALVEDSQVLSQLSNAMPLTQTLPSAADRIQVAAGTEIVSNASLFGEPTHAVFLLANGESDPIPLERNVFFSKKHLSPVTGTEMILTATSVPEGAVAIKMADDTLTQQLLEDDSTQFTLIGKYLAADEKVSWQDHVVSDSCYNPSTEQYKQNLCFTPSNGNYCSNNISALGAPLVANINTNKPVLIGFKPSYGCGFLNDPSSSFAASARLVSWANLQGLKQQGLKVVSAYEFGEYEKRSHQALTITFENESIDQKFDLKGFHMNDLHVMSVVNNNCEVLMPSESCSVALHTTVPESVNYMEVLNFNALNVDAGIFVSLNGYQEKKFKSDRKSHWRVSGWKTVRGAGFGRHQLGGHLITQSSFSDSPTITRNEYVDGPTKVKVTYRTSDDSIFSLMILDQRKSLKDTNQLWSLNGFMPGTNGEWQTGVLEITEPGRYSISLRRGAISIGGEPLEDLEVKDVCIGECDI